MTALYDVWAQIVEDNLPHEITNSPLLQFGKPNRRYLGATLLPDVPKRRNQFTETKITYRSFPAQDATRYSAPKLQGGQLVGGFDVKLGEIDTASQLTGDDLDTLIEVADDNPEQARAQLINWLTNSFGISLTEKEEIQRWGAIVNAQVTIRGMDGNVETVDLTNPAGHRVTVASGTTGSPAGWYLDTYDLMEDILAMKTLLNDKGYEINRIIGDTQVLSAISTNGVMQNRLGGITIDNGTLTSRAGVVDIATLNSYLTAQWGLPPIERYDLAYNTASGRAYFKPRGSLVFVCTTGREETIETGNVQQEAEVITDTLGYYAIGRAVGEVNPGRKTEFEVKTMKPVGIHGQGFQTSFPVITEPEAICVLNIPLPTAS